MAGESREERSNRPESDPCSAVNGAAYRSGGSVVSEHLWEEFPIDGPILAKMKVCSVRFSGPYSRFWAWQPTLLCRFGGRCWQPSPLVMLPGGSPTVATGSSRPEYFAWRFFVLRPTVLRSANRVLGLRYARPRPAHHAGSCTSAGDTPGCAIPPPQSGQKSLGSRAFRG